MNIFEYDGEEFDKKLDEIFANNNQSVYYISCFSFKYC